MIVGETRSEREMIPSPPTTCAKGSTLDGLPKSFLHVLKTLFDILDDEGTGLVKFSGKH